MILLKIKIKKSPFGKSELRWYLEKETKDKNNGMLKKIKNFITGCYFFEKKQ